MPVGNVFGASSTTTANVGPAKVSGSLEAGFGPSGPQGGVPPARAVVRSPLGGAMVFSTACVVALVLYWWILP